MTLNYGWCEVNDDFKLAFEDSEFSVKFVNSITNLPIDTTYGWSFGEIRRTFALLNVRFKTTEDAEDMLDKIKDLQVTGDPYKVEWQIHSDGGAGDFFEFDGDTGYMKCLCDEISAIKKVSGGDQTIYKSRKIAFIEASK